MPKPERLTMLAELLRDWRHMNRRDLRETALEMGIGHTTLFRIEQGRIPDADTWVKIQAWLLSAKAE